MGRHVQCVRHEVTESGVEEIGVSVESRARRPQARNTAGRGLNVDLAKQGLVEGSRDWKEDLTSKFAYGYAVDFILSAKPEMARGLRSVKQIGVKVRVWL